MRALGLWLLAATVWAAVDPADWATWFFELFLGAGGVIVLMAIAPRFPFSKAVYATAAVHYMILAAGAGWARLRLA